jgi:hypothetical protein
MNMSMGSTTMHMLAKKHTPRCPLRDKVLINGVFSGLQASALSREMQKVTMFRPNLRIGEITLSGRDFISLN